MKNLRFYFTVAITSLITTICSAQISSKIIQKDFLKLAGIWEGSLTYLDYSSGKPYKMPANVEIKMIGKTSSFAFSNSYPNEKSANSIDTITISADGNYINKELVKSRRKLPEGAIEIITEEAGKDGNDNKPATIKHTYTLSTTTYKTRKDVKFTGETAWINRHEYSFKRKI